MNYKGQNKIIYQDSEIIKFLIESPKYGDKEITIDTEDYDRVKNYRWFLNYQPKINKFYVIAHDYKNNGRIVKLHRFILNLNNPNIECDHRFGDTFDNRKKVLRECDHFENMRNQKKQKTNTSGFKGVSWKKNLNKWFVQIRANNKVKYLGIYEDKIEAAKVYNEAALKYHGEFAQINNLEKEGNLQCR